MKEENKKQVEGEKNADGTLAEGSKKATKKIEEEKPVKARKENAVVNGKDLPISTKHAVFICKAINGKSLEKAVDLLEQVKLKKKFIHMTGEIPHRKGGKGRYPVKAAGIFIRLLKNLAANSNVNGLENAYITKAVSNKASQPFRRFGSRRFKRTHVFLEAREKLSKEATEPIRAREGK